MENKLTELLKDRDDVIAAWLGGSAATGFCDEFSDIDYLMVCNDDAIETVIKVVDNFFDAEFGIEKRFRVPEPAWHGFSQCFYKLKETPIHAYLDISFLKRSLKDKFTGSARHGDAVILFDKESVIDTSPEPHDIRQNRVRTILETIKERDFIQIAEVTKAIQRNRFSEAFQAYYQFIVRYLAVALNSVHRPAKVDFGLRYSYRDYSPADAFWIESLMKVNDISELEHKFNEALKRYKEII